MPVKQSLAVTSVDGDEWFIPLCPLLMCPSEAKLAFENVGQSLFYLFITMFSLLQSLFVI